MVDLGGLKKIRHKSDELTEWAKAAYVAEETIMQLSNYIKELTYKRASTKDLKYRAKYDLEIAKLEEHRAGQELRKAKAVGEMKDLIRAIVDNFGR